MCVIEIEICSACSTMKKSEMKLCDNGERGYVCVGPNTVSGVPRLSIENNTVTGKREADMTTVMPSNVTMIRPANCPVCAN